MEAYLLEWANLFFRWFHVIAGIAWIGASFYFVWLDNSLENPPQWKKDKGIGGDLWAIHGGGFYEVAKYKLGPEKMPENLHWFKWEAYTTWLTGMVMLWIVYYIGAESFLIDNSRLELTQWQAIGLGMGYIAVGFAVYEMLVKTPLRHNGKAFGLVLFSFLVFMAWFASEVFSPRGAFIHVGALIGTIMAGNVFLGIMPSQRALVEAVQRGEAPDPKYGAFAKLRSTHNNYFTLPLIFIMISNHYPMTYSHELNWLVLSAICFILAFARHFFNLRHRGEFKPSILLIAAIMMAGVAVWIAPKPVEVNEEVVAGFTDQQGMAIIKERCASCHAATPTQAGFASPPAGVSLETMDQVMVIKPKLIEVINSSYMPLGNITQMTDKERQQVIGWLSM
ncbi:urate hydroxylase PuuD [Litoribrevibacter euphylliae]|uniref:Urate hydroxylase PuuD n=1 Tax=Litoribrevibacter euphylliae TaxID=1834034 RepID=A0ABV7HJP7_9GAMM